MLSTIEFAYNNFVHGSTSKSPFECVYGYQPRNPIDLVPLPNSHIYESAENVSQHMHDLYIEIKHKIAMNN